MAIQLPADKYIKIGGINTRYWEAGEKGSTVILIHGLPGNVENWTFNINALAQNHRVYALDLPGCGRTDKQPLIKKLQELVDFIKNFLYELNIDKATLVGFSLGGGLALYFTIQQPEKVEKLVLVDSAGFGREVAFLYRLLSVPFLGRFMMRHPTPKHVENLLKLVIYNSDIIKPDIIKKSYELTILPGATEALVSILHAGASLWGQRKKNIQLITDALDNIKTPTLIFWGKQDRVIPFKHAQVAARISGSRLHIFDKCGHMPIYEYPEEFNRVVLDFLAE